MSDQSSLIITNSGIPGAVPTPGFITLGELVLNWADGALYFKDKNGDIQSISSKGVAPIVIEERLPENEGPWDVLAFPDDPENTEYIIVQREEGDLPRLKIGIITEGVNFVSVDDVDITVGVYENTTMNDIRALIENDEDANALIYIYNAEDSDGTGIVTPPILGSADFEDANPISGDRTEILGHTLIVKHSDESISEWGSSRLFPTQWLPRTSGIIFNHTSNKWEKLKVLLGTIQTDLLPDQS
jgi:hypothetical protein